MAFASVGRDVRVGSILNTSSYTSKGVPVGTCLARLRAPLVFVAFALALAGCGDLPTPAACSTSTPCPSGVLVPIGPVRGQRRPPSP